MTPAEELAKILDDECLLYQVDLKMHGRAEPMSTRVFRRMAEAGMGVTREWKREEN